MSEVVSLTGGLTHQREVVPNCVSVLEDLLERARAGEIVGVAVAGLYYDATAAYWVGGRVGGYGMIGALEMIRADLVEINRE